MGWAKAQGLTLSEGLALMEEAFPFVVNDNIYKFFGAALAEARFDAGRVTDALALVDHARQYRRGPGEWTIRPRNPPASGCVLKKPWVPRRGG